MNPILGEIWYELLLVGQPSPTKLINSFKAEIGKFHEEIVEIENPSPRDIKFSLEITNPTNFSVYPKDIVAKGY